MGREMEKIMVRTNIDSCRQCQSLLAYQLGAYSRYKWVCLETLRDISFPSDSLPEWCPLKEESESDTPDKKLTVTKEWIEDLGNLFFDLEHSHDEPVDRLVGQMSRDEVWTEIEGMFDEVDIEVLRGK